MTGKLNNIDVIISFHFIIEKDCILSLTLRCKPIYFHGELILFFSTGLTTLTTI